MTPEVQHQKQIAEADLEYVLAWLRQTEAPENVIRLQERGIDYMLGRENPFGYGPAR